MYNRCVYTIVEKTNSYILIQDRGTEEYHSVTTDMEYVICDAFARFIPAKDMWETKTFGIYYIDSFFDYTKVEYRISEPADYKCLSQRDIVITNWLIIGQTYEEFKEHLLFEKLAK